MSVRQHQRCRKEDQALECHAFFELLSSLGDDDGEFSKDDGFVAATRNELLVSLSKAFDKWLPRVLQLEPREVVKVADFNIIRDVLDTKLTKPLAMLVVLLDGIANGVILGCYVAGTLLMVRHDGPLKGREIALLGAAILCDFYIAVREYLQAKAMSRLGLFGSWATDWGNLLDVFAVVSVLTTSGIALFGPSTARSETWFRILVVGASCSLWLEVLSFLKILHKKTATFVLSIFQILTDLREFMIVLLLFVLMFTNAFYLLLSSAENSSSSSDAADDDEASPFTSFGETLLTMYRMMLGDFERDWFTSESKEVAGVTVALFVIFTFLVMVLLLNMLIAIISDSCEHPSQCWNVLSFSYPSFCVFVLQMTSP